MTTDRQIEANRYNARRSTGPNTERGRERACYNGLKHGLYARDVLLPGENVEAYDKMLDELIAEYAPDGPSENALVRRAADLMWRLGRTAAIEAGFLSPDWSRDPRAQKRFFNDAPIIDGFEVVIGRADVLDQLGRYESRLDRALARTLDILERMRRRRVGAAAEPKT